jgi:hypothetical protein
MTTCFEELRMPPKGHKFNLNTTVDPQTVLRMDDYRRNIPRSRIVEMAVIEYLDRKKEEEDNQ